MQKNIRIRTDPITSENTNNGNIAAHSNSELMVSEAHDLEEYSLFGCSSRIFLRVQLRSYLCPYLGMKLVS